MKYFLDLIQEIKKCAKAFNRQQMDQNSLDYLRNTYTSEFNPQWSLYFLYDDKNAEKKLQRVNVPGFIGKLRPKSKRKEGLKQPSEKTLFQSNEILIHSENFRSNKNEAFLYSGKNIDLTIKSLAFQSHSVLAS